MVGRWCGGGVGRGQGGDGRRGLKGARAGKLRGVPE